MRYHIQEHLWNVNDETPRGSCYPTVLACILDLELHEVPYFHLLYFKTEKEKESIKKYLQDRWLGGKTVEEFKGEDHKISNYEDTLSNALHWIWDNVREFWLASKGYKETWIAKENIDKWIEENPSTPYIVCGKSARGVDHVVIYLSGKMIHDPHPSGSGVFETEKDKFSYSYLEKIC